MVEPTRPADRTDASSWTPGRLLLGALVVGMLGFWIWVMAMSFGVLDSPDNPDLLGAADYAEEVEPRCAATLAAVDDLPSPRDAETPAERAMQVRRGTDLIATLVGELHRASQTVREPGDLVLLERWLDDWDAYVDDRRRHEAKLETADLDTSDRDLAFTLTERAGGGIYTRRIDQFAAINEMASCKVPGDI